MASYYQKSVSLSNAMAVDIPYITRIWSVEGLQVQWKSLPEKSHVNKTFVMKHADGNTTVGIEYTVEGFPATFMKSIAKFPQFNLDTLQKEFESLFQLTGNLYAFGEKSKKE